jgi:hypothetical protein
MSTSTPKTYYGLAFTVGLILTCIIDLKNNHFDIIVSVFIGSIIIGIITYFEYVMIDKGLQKSREKDNTLLERLLARLFWACGIVSGVSAFFFLFQDLVGKNSLMNFVFGWATSLIFFSVILFVGLFILVFFALFRFIIKKMLTRNN